MWYKGDVIPGKQIGRQIGFPTINIANHSIFSTNTNGVYLVEVMLPMNKKANGLLYFGPRHIVNENDIVLEIYLLDNIGSYTWQTISFTVLSYIRPVIPFTSLAEAKMRQNKDLEEAKKLIKKRAV